MKLKKEMRLSRRPVTAAELRVNEDIVFMCWLRPTNGVRYFNAPSFRTRFFHTILMKSRFSGQLANKELTYRRFVGGAGSPVQLGLEDLPVDDEPLLLEALNKLLNGPGRVH
jgi:hypothetical protein